MRSCRVFLRLRQSRILGRRLVAPALAALLALAGCGRERGRAVPELEFESTGDTSGLSEGAPLLAEFTPVRHPNGLLQLRGGLRLPDRTRVQISVYRADDSALVARTQLAVTSGRFESPPLLGERGPLPPATYRFEFLAHFNSAWQPPEVLAATDHGRRLRGPGMMRGSRREVAFLLNREQRL